VFLVLPVIILPIGEARRTVPRSLREGFSALPHASAAILERALLPCARDSRATGDGTVI
jgi:hypothetical protein